jgi:hypothetical protein
MIFLISVSYLQLCGKLQIARETIKVIETKKKGSTTIRYVNIRLWKVPLFLESTIKKAESQAKGPYHLLNEADEAIPDSLKTGAEKMSQIAIPVEFSFILNTSGEVI